MKGLIIKPPWIDYILDGHKIWEIRGARTNIRGEIFLIKSGTGCIYGKANLVDCFEISLGKYQESFNMHMIPRIYLDVLPYKKTFAWVINNAERFDVPIPYKHPKGAIIWVNI